MQDSPPVGASGSGKSTGQSSGVGARRYDGERAGQILACSMPDDHLDLIASSFALLFAIARSVLN